MPKIFFFQTVGKFSSKFCFKTLDRFFRNKSLFYFHNLIWHFRNQFFWRESYFSLRSFHQVYRNNFYSTKNPLLVSFFYKQNFNNFSFKQFARKKSPERKNFFLIFVKWLTMKIQLKCPQMKKASSYILHSFSYTSETTKHFLMSNFVISNGILNIPSFTYLFIQTYS